MIKTFTIALTCSIVVIIIVLVISPHNLVCVSQSSRAFGVPVCRILLIRDCHSGHCQRKSVRRATTLALLESYLLEDKPNYRRCRLKQFVSSFCECHYFTFTVMITYPCRRHALLLAPSHRRASVDCSALSDVSTFGPKEWEWQSRAVEST